jgi:hypothetical protein
MEEFIKYVNLLCEKPGMFKINKVEDIYYMISGYVFALESLKAEKLNELMKGFNKFLDDNDEPMGVNWEVNIHIHSGGNDQYSLKLFKMKFEMYIDSILRKN